MRLSSQRPSQSWSPIAGAQDADLELPLALHDLGVRALDRQPCLHAGRRVALDDLAPDDVVGADRAVVGALRCGEADLGPAEWPALLEERVFLLDAEHRFLVGVLLGDLDARRPGVRRVRREVGEQDLAEHEHVLAAPERVGHDEHGLQDAVGTLPGA